MIYQQPLAYLLGIEGVALLRTWAGDFDRAYGEARIAEVRRLLGEPALAGDGVLARRVGSAEGYRTWSSTYDEPGNGIFAYEEPIVREMLAGRPPGTALDAACGTGRHAAHLAAAGHRVIGVDSSPDMLARARDRVPSGDFRSGDLHRLPVADGSVDIVVCALALTHVADLGPVMAEFARVLRPGGELVTADVHPLRVVLGSVPRVRSAGGEPQLLTGYRHLTADYLDAALGAGFRVRRCAEPLLPRDEPPEPAPDGPPDEIDPGPWEAWPWSLLELVPAAARAASAGTPATVVWHFQLDPAGA